jgi:DNA-binding beta-propeller fold protein YncE
MMNAQINKIIIFITGLVLVFSLASCVSVKTKAGSGTAGFQDGAANTAQFNKPYGLVSDPWQNVYVADCYNNRIRQIVNGPNNVVTFAGTGAAGCTNGHILNAATFNHPVDVARDNAGNFYVADRDNHVIRMINIGTGMVSTLAGQCGRSTPHPSGCGEYNPVPDSVSAEQALFNTPSGVAVDERGNVYVADYWDCSIRKIDAKTHMVTIVGKNPNSKIGCCSCLGLFSFPTGVDVDANGNIFVAEYWGNNQIKKIDPSGNVTVWAGVAPGYRDGAGITEARFMHPYHLVVNKANGDIYVADAGNNRIRKIKNDSLHTVCTVAGNGVSGFSDDSWIGSTCSQNDGHDAQFNRPAGIEFVKDFLLYIGDSDNNRVREIDP